MHGKTIGQLSIGDTAEFSKTIAESDVYGFAGITGDFNPAHIDQVYAANTIFKGRIAHGMLSAGMISAVIGTRLPGPGTIYMSQSLRFCAPVKIGDTVTARVEVTELIEAKNRAKLSTICTIQDGTLVLEGEALVMLPEA
jgi:3-hydroxybutyryl-CoA dehydratase